MTSKVSLVKKHSQVAGLKNRIRTFLSSRTTGAKGYLAYCFSSSECVAAPIFRQVPVAWFTRDVSFPTAPNGWKSHAAFLSTFYTYAESA